MDLYGFLKFLHVLAAVIWVGGGITFVVFTLAIGPNTRRLLSLMAEMAQVGLVMLTPASLTVLITGGLLVWAGEWGFEAWVAISLVLALLSAVNGGALLGPGLGKVKDRLAAGDEPGALAAARPVLPFSRLEQGSNILVVLMMVMKPGWGDLWLIVVAAIILAALVALIIRRSPLPAAI
ncbi:DUF2269 family protein [Pseudoroseicyclus sp. H15]